MKTVYKFKLNMGGRTSVPFRTGEVVLAGRDHSGFISLWVECWPNQETNGRDFLVYGTGYEIPTDAKHEASFIDEGFVWHVYGDQPPY